MAQAMAVSAIADKAKVPSVAGSIATPTAILFVLGLGLMYFALHGWDVKYGLFNGRLGGKANNSPSDTTKPSGGGGGGAGGGF